jgi:hypothetical protein
VLSTFSNLRHFTAASLVRTVLPLELRAFFLSCALNNSSSSSNCRVLVTTSTACRLPEMVVVAMVEIQAHEHKTVIRCASVDLSFFASLCYTSTRSNTLTPSHAITRTHTRVLGRPHGSDGSAGECSCNGCWPV